MRVGITRPAKVDLTTIALFIAADNPPRALSFTGELRRECKALAMTWRQHPYLAGYEGGGIRRKRHQRYLILYRVGDDRIDVVRIVHGARDLAALMLPTA